MYLVVFINERGQRVSKEFTSPKLARDFARKVKYSKKLRLVFEPLYD